MGILLKTTSNGVNFHEDEMILITVTMFKKLHSGVVLIREYKEFDRLDKEKQDECFEKLESILQDFEKDKGEVIRVVYERSDTFRCFVRNQMKWKKRDSKKGLAYELWIEKKALRIEGEFFSWQVCNEKYYKRDQNMIESCKRAIAMCKQKYVIYGTWRVDELNFYYYKKTGRSVRLGLENGQYYVQWKDKTYVIKKEVHAVSEIAIFLLSILKKIKKQERMLHLYKEENLSYLFSKYIRDYNFRHEQINNLWIELRKIHSYDELEYESFSRLEKNESLFYQQEYGMLFGKFLSSYFVLERIGDICFVSNERESLLQRIAERQKERWDTYLDDVEEKQ